MAAAVRLPQLSSGKNMDASCTAFDTRAFRIQCILVVQCITWVCGCVQTYVVHLRDAVRKTERDFKVTTQNNTVEYMLKGLEPGGRYSITVRLRNMTKEASYTLNTGTQPTTALKTQRNPHSGSQVPA